MIKFENRYDEYSYRISGPASAALPAVFEEGTWVTLNNLGEVVVSDGSKKSFMATASRRPGRDTINPSGMVTYLFGHYNVSTDKFNPAGSYSVMSPLKVIAGGILSPWIQVSDTVDEIVAYCITPPGDGFIQIAVKP